MAAAGDVSGDGHDDLVVGDPDDPDSQELSRSLRPTGGQRLVAPSTPPDQCTNSCRSSPITTRATRKTTCASRPAYSSRHQSPKLPV
ncbi:FG-GAP repeat protein [Streptomyces sp. NPDC001651]|uniref:FG-GAP repeat protein n=1 Tax=Streptomyces sp. NPDC001651 TaxID=3364596 RepID=UPI0036CA4C1F